MEKPHRPLSPHLQIYRPQITSVLSILHRFTGMGLILGLGVMAWALLALSCGAPSYESFRSFWPTFMGLGLRVILVTSLFYHFFNGVRHLFWDAGQGLDLKSVKASGWFVVVASAVGTILYLIF